MPEWQPSEWPRRRSQGPAREATRDWGRRRPFVAGKDRQVPAPVFAPGYCVIDCFPPPRPALGARFLSVGVWQPSRSRSFSRLSHCCLKSASTVSLAFGCPSCSPHPEFHRSSPAAPSPRSPLAMLSQCTSSWIASPLTARVRRSRRVPSARRPLRGRREGVADRRRCSRALPRQRHPASAFDLCAAGVRPAMITCGRGRVRRQQAGQAARVPSAQRILHAVASLLAGWR